MMTTTVHSLLVDQHFTAASECVSTHLVVV